MPSPVDVALADLARTLNRVGVRWFLFGAQAAILYGSTRVTEDIDVTVELGRITPRALVEALARGGFTLRVRDTDGFIARTRVMPVVHRATRMPVDVVFAGPGLEERFMDRRRNEKRGRIELPVATPEDIVVMKILAGRPHDLDDVRAVVRGLGDALDVAYLTETVAQLEDALGQSDLMPLLKNVLADLRRGRRAKPVAKRRRVTKAKR
ncbi:MAG: hypothetical protein KF819_33150 [Labilithrix sp.]|nr:hypothetical protein [Labilithrix sp.]